MHPGTNHNADGGKKVGGEMVNTTYQPLMTAIEMYLKKAEEDLEEIFESEGRAEPEESVNAVDRIETGIENALTDQTDFLLGEIKKHTELSSLLAAGVLEKIFESDNTCDAIRDVVSREFKDLIPKLTKGYVGFIDTELKINAVSQRTLDWIDDWSIELADMMKVTAHDALSKMIQDSFAKGNDISSLTLDIMENGIRDEYYRARRAAVTEVLRAHNVSKQEAAMQNPAVTQKMWRHTGAHKNEPRENHVAMDGQIVDKDKPFTLTGADGSVHYPMYPVDPSLPASESVNCHCIAQDIVDENILGLPLEERQRLQQEAIDRMNAEYEEEKAQKGIDNDGGSGIIKTENQKYLINEIDNGNISLVINKEVQNRHYKDTNEYSDYLNRGIEKSYFNIPQDKLQNFLNQKYATGDVRKSRNGAITEILDYGENIAYDTKLEKDTSFVKAHYSKDRTHLVPFSPKDEE